MQHQQRNNDKTIHAAQNYKETKLWLSSIKAHNDVWQGKTFGAYAKQVENLQLFPQRASYSGIGKP